MQSLNIAPYTCDLWHSHSIHNGGFLVPFYFWRVWEMKVANVSERKWLCIQSRGKVKPGQVKLLLSAWITLKMRCHYTNCKSWIYRVYRLAQLHSKASIHWKVNMYITIYSEDSCIYFYSRTAYRMMTRLVIVRARHVWYWLVRAKQPCSSNAIKNNSRGRIDY